MSQRFQVADRKWCVFGTAAVLTLVAVLLVPTTVRAQGAAMIDPPTRVARAEPGMAVEGSMRITNPSDRPMRLRMYLSDWSMDAQGEFRFMPAGASPASASEWVSYSPTVIDLPSEDTVDLDYVVEVPPDVDSGSYRTVLFVESEPGEPEPGQLGASVSVRVGHVLYVNVPPLMNDGAITGMFGERTSENGDPYRLFVRYANTGNAVHAASGELSVRDATGEPVIEVAIDRNVVLPGSEREFEIDLFGPLEPGNYTALVVLDYGDDEQQVAGTYDFRLERPLERRGAP
jgi:hypothetical protein